MRRRIVVRAAAFGAAAAVIAGAPADPIAPALADPPQCQYGEYVTADCPSGGCVGDDLQGIDDLCSGPVLEPLFPPGPQVNVKIRGGVGIGF